MIENKEAYEAYMAQTEHPDLVTRICDCGEPHLNDPLVAMPLCLECFAAWQVGNGLTGN